MDYRFALGCDPLPAHGLDEHEQNAPAVEGRKRQQVGQTQGQADEGRGLQYRERQPPLDALLEGEGQHPADADHTGRPCLLWGDVTLGQARRHLHGRHDRRENVIDAGVERIGEPIAPQCTPIWPR